VQVLYPKKQQQVIAKILEFKVDFKGYNPNINYCGNDWGWFVWPKLEWSFKNLDKK